MVWVKNGDLLINMDQVQCMGSLWPLDFTAFLTRLSATLPHVYGYISMQCTLRPVTLIPDKKKFGLIGRASNQWISLR